MIKVPDKVSNNSRLLRFLHGGHELGVMGPETVPIDRWHATEYRLRTDK